LNDSDLGELSIAIPEDLIVLASSSDLHASRAHRRANTSALSQQTALGGVGDDVGQAVVDELFTAQFAPLIVRIEYTLEEPLGGLYFVQPDGAFAEREACVFTESHHRLARCWMPCFDTLMNHLTWQIELDVPADCMAVCVGDLRRHELSPDEQRKFFAYELSTPTLACDIGFAVGPFVPLVDPSRPSTVTHFCLPRHRALLREPARCVSSTLDFLDEFLRTPLPYGSYKQVFVDEAYAEVSSHASLAICSAELLHDEAHIEVAMRARRLLTQAVVRQYFGCLLSPATWCDTWLLYGLATHVARLAMVPTFGLNELRFELAQLQRAAYPRDDDGSLGPAAPLYSAGRIDAVELLLDEVWCARSTLVMHLIERNVGVDAMKKCLGALFLTPEGHVALQPPRRCWDTHGFMTHIKRLTGHDLRATASLYIFGRGDCPVTAGFAFNKRQRQFEFAFRLHFDGMLQEDTDALLENPQPLTVRVVETDGIYDHQVVLSDLDTVTSVPWYSRQRNTNRYRKRAVPMLQDMAQQQQENGTAEMRKLRKTIAAFAQNVPAFPTFAHGGDVPSAPGSPGGGAAGGGGGGGSPPGSPGGAGGGDDDDEGGAGGAKTKKAIVRAKYAHDPTVDKYTGIPLTSASDVPVQWIHLDPLVQHLAPITQRQPLSMWLSMLQYSADVLSQSTAIRALDASESVPMQALVHMLCNPAVFWRVRVVAASQLRNGAGTRAAGVDANWRPLEELLDFYKSRHL
jgi:hypothetical protein